MAKGSARARVAAVVRRLAPGGSADAQAEAAHALARLCSDKSRNKEYVRGCGGVAALVGLLAPGGPPAVQQRAAAALESLCVEDRASQDSMRECGGVIALVALLAPGGSAHVRQRAAVALRSVCYANKKTRKVSGSAVALPRWSNSWRPAALRLCTNRLLRRCRACAMTTHRTGTA